MDTIAVTGETAFSEDLLPPVIQSWVILFQNDFKFKNLVTNRSKLGHASDGLYVLIWYALALTPLSLPLVVSMTKTKI